MKVMPMQNCEEGINTLQNELEEDPFRHRKLMDQALELGHLMSSGKTEDRHKCAGLTSSNFKIQVHSKF